MAKVQVDESEVRRVVGEVLASGEYEINRTYDDAGLSEEEYYKFARDVLRKLGQFNSFG